MFVDFPLKSSELGEWTITFVVCGIAVFRQQTIGPISAMIFTHYQFSLGAHIFRLTLTTDRKISDLHPLGFTGWITIDGQDYRQRRVIILDEGGLVSTDRPEQPFLQFVTAKALAREVFRAKSS